MDLDSIREQMKMTLSDSIIPAEKTGAFVTVYDGKQLITAVATRINGTWEIEGHLGFIKGSKNLNGGIKVRATW